MFNQLYSAATLAASVPLYPLFLSRARGRARIGERYGYWSLNLEDCLWIHGASVGEMNGLTPVMRAIKHAAPGLPLLATATSVTGLEKAAPVSDVQRLLPFDSQLYLSRALARVRPRAFVFAETELWPGLLNYLRQREVPRLLVNARMSDHSFPRYRMLKPIVQPLLSGLDQILVSDQISEERFLALGAPRERVLVVGNAKYDLSPALTAPDEINKLRRWLFSEEWPILVLASLRPGEEEVWFTALSRAYAAGANLNVIIGPRHQEKFAFFAERLDAFGLKFIRRSEASAEGPAASGVPILLLDTMGELNRMFAVADAAFVGATLIPIGGHNPLEPAMYGACPVLGPYTQNVSDITDSLQRAGALIRIGSEADIAEVIELVVDRSDALREKGARAKQVWQQYCGATSRIVAKILPFLQRKAS